MYCFKFVENNNKTQKRHLLLIRNFLKLIPPNWTFNQNCSKMVGIPKNFIVPCIGNRNNSNKCVGVGRMEVCVYFQPPYFQQITVLNKHLRTRHCEIFATITLRHMLANVYEFWLAR